MGKASQNQTLPLLEGQKWHPNPVPGRPPVSDHRADNEEARGPEEHADSTWNLGVGRVKGTVDWKKPFRKTKLSSDNPDPVLIQRNKTQTTQALQVCFYNEKLSKPISYVR